MSQEQLPHGLCVSQTSSSTCCRRRAGPASVPASARPAAGRAQPQGSPGRPRCPPRLPGKSSAQRAGGTTSKNRSLFGGSPGKTPPSSPAPRSPACSLPPRLGRSQGFLPLQALLPPSNFYSSLPGASAARPTPKQKGPKGDTPSGTPESSGTSAGCRTADLQKPRKGAAEPSLSLSTGPAGKHAGEGPFPEPPGRVGRPAACGGGRQRLLRRPTRPGGEGLAPPDPGPHSSGSRDPSLQTRDQGQEHRLCCQTGLSSPRIRWVTRSKAPARQSLHGDVPVVRGPNTCSAGVAVTVALITITAQWGHGDTGGGSQPKASLGPLGLSSVWAQKPQAPQGQLRASVPLRWLRGPILALRRLPRPRRGWG